MVWFLIVVLLIILIAAVSSGKKKTKLEIEKLQNEKKESQPLSQGIADELKKLSELREQGILTEEEFQQQKKKILG